VVHDLVLFYRVGFRTRKFRQMEIVRPFKHCEIDPSHRTKHQERPHGARYFISSPLGVEQYDWVKTYRCGVATAFSNSATDGITNRKKGGTDERVHFRVKCVLESPPPFLIERQVHHTIH
jgi:hypothetical protein